VAGFLRSLVRPQQVGQSLASDRLACLGRKKRKQSACFLRAFPEPTIATLDHQRPENADRQRHRNRPNILLATPRKAGMESRFISRARSALNLPEAGPAVPMTSNPKVQNHQRSSANFLAFGSEKFWAVVSTAKSLHKPEG